MRKRAASLLCVAVVMVIGGCVGCSSTSLGGSSATSTPIAGKGDRPYMYCGRSFGDAWPIVVDATRKTTTVVPSAGGALVLLSRTCAGDAVTVSSSGPSESLVFYRSAGHAFAVGVPAGTPQLTLSLTDTEGNTRRLTLVRAGVSG
jgi:hypothetical protein